MFNPYPYNDPNAVNRIENDGSVDLGRTAIGNAAVAAVLQKEVRPGRVIGIDGYATVPFGAVIGLLPKTAEFISVASLYKSADELRTLLADYLPEDREKDPVLLYGKIFKDGYEGIFDAAKLAALQETLKNKGDRCIVLYGNGALTEVLRGLVDVRIYVDVTPKKAVLNIKAGGYRNFGLAGAPPLALRERRSCGTPARWPSRATGGTRCTPTSSSPLVRRKRSIDSAALSWTMMATASTRPMGSSSAATATGTKTASVTGRSSGSRTAPCATSATSSFQRPTANLTAAATSTLAGVATAAPLPSTPSTKAPGRFTSSTATYRTRRYDIPNVLRKNRDQFPRFSHRRHQ